MIVSQRDGRLILIAQEEHARLAGLLAARLAQPPEPEDALVAAARIHDNGWREADAEPRFDADTGRPHSYRSLPDADYLDVWARGIRRAVEVDARVGVLTSLHGARFLRVHHGGAMRTFHEQELARQDMLLKRLGLDGDSSELPPEIAESSDWLLFVDAISLFACGEWGDRMQTRVGARTFTATRDGARVHVDPWPFTRATNFELPVRALSSLRFADARAFTEALRDAARVVWAGEIAEL